MPESLRRVLLRVTTCSRLDGSLADALLEGDDGARLLEECFRAGLFLERSADDEGGLAYRWHEAFAEQCRQITAREDPALARRLHLIAAEHLETPSPPEAVEHALLGGSPDLARSIIRRQWLRMALAAQSAALDRLCLALPSAQGEERDILLIRACCRSLLRDRAGADLLHRRARSAPQDPSTPFVEAFADLLLAATPAEKARATDRATAVLGRRSPQDDYPHGLFLLGWSEITLRRDGPRAVDLLLSALHEAQSRALPHLARAAAVHAAFGFSFVGRFTTAEATLDAVAPPVEQSARSGQWPEGGIAGYIRGHNRFWGGELHEALDRFSTTIGEDDDGTPIAGLSRAFFAMTVAELGRADLYETAERRLAEIGEADEQGVPWSAYKRLAAGRLLEARGRLPEALRTVEPLLARDDVPVALALLAEMHRRRGDHSRALASLRRLHRGNRPQYADLLAGTTLAAIDHAEGRTDASRRRLLRSITTAVEHGTLFPLLARDRAFGQMLEDLASTGAEHEEHLAVVFALRERMHADAAHARLTPRERELYGYLRTNMSAAEIAAVLHLSVATVKTHFQSIYRKLGVTSRRGALRVRR